MMGLILKDVYTIVSQAKFFLILIAVMAFLQSDFIFAYAVFYAAMLPVTALGYDERAKWNTIADMMPYTAEQIVGSKYMMGYAMVAFSAALVVIGRLVGAAFGNPFNPEFFAPLVLVACGALSLEAVMLPAMFWLGVERGRLLFIAVVVVGIVGSVSLLENLDFTLMQGSFLSLTLGAALLTACVNAVSFLLSKKLYRRG